MGRGAWVSLRKPTFKRYDLDVYAIPIGVRSMTEMGGLWTFVASARTLFETHRSGRYLSFGLHKSKSLMRILG